jgi:hypothetical protein
VFEARTNTSRPTNPLNARLLAGPCNPGKGYALIAGQNGNVRIWSGGRQSKNASNEWYFGGHAIREKNVRGLECPGLVRIIDFTPAT